MKQCSVCGKKKNSNDFSKVSRNKDGLCGKCTSCKEVEKFVKARRSHEYIHNNAREAAVNAI